MKPRLRSCPRLHARLRHGLSLPAACACSRCVHASHLAGSLADPACTRASVSGRDSSVALLKCPVIHGLLGGSSRVAQAGAHSLHLRAPSYSQLSSDPACKIDSLTAF